MEMPRPTCGQTASLPYALVDISADTIGFLSQPNLGNYPFNIVGRKMLGKASLRSLMVSDVTPDMVEAGAAVIEARFETATFEQLASLVYIAMVSAREGQGRAQAG
jgi:hypothetical protein